MNQTADGLTKNSSSYILCLQRFDDLLYYCQQFPHDPQVKDSAEQVPQRNSHPREPLQVNLMQAYSQMSMNSGSQLDVSDRNQMTPQKEKKCSQQNRSIKIVARDDQKEDGIHFCNQFSWLCAANTSGQDNDRTSKKTPEKFPSSPTLSIITNDEIESSAISGDRIKSNQKLSNIRNEPPAESSQVIITNTPMNTPFNSSVTHHSLISNKGVDFSPMETKPRRHPRKQTKSSADQDSQHYSILKRPLRTPLTQYDGFYAEYCKSLCRCRPCINTCPQFDLIKSFLMDKTNCVPKVDKCPVRCTHNESKCKSAKDLSSDMTKLKKESIISPSKPAIRSSKRIKISEKIPSQSSRRKACCEAELQSSGSADIHVLEATPSLQSTSPVLFTSTIMMLFFVMIAIYTVGLNIGEFVTYKTGLHGRTFFLVPYTLRSITIGFVLMSDFLAFLMCPNSMCGFVDLACRTFVFSFLADTVWNMMEWTMETRQVNPLLYFGFSFTLCLLAMFSFFRFVSRHT